MNRHAFADNLPVVIGAIVAGKKKYFAESIDSRPFSELIGSVDLAVPDVFAEGTWEIAAQTAFGPVDPALRVEKWAGAEHPTVIYHHGNGERPFDYTLGVKNTFYNIFVREKRSFNGNLIALRAPFHNFSLKEYQNKMLHLRNFMIMAATGARLVEEVIAAIRKQGEGRIVTSGISLGGFVANLHRTYFNTSNFYAPLLAGTFLGELFITSTYRKLAAPDASERSMRIKRLMDFNEDFDRVWERNVFPLLAKHDQYIEYELQKKSYSGHGIKTMDAGHLTGALRAGEIRDHVMGIIGM